VPTLRSATIGDDNVAVGRSLLREMGIRITRQETGGDHGRKLLFNTATGELIIRPLRGHSEAPHGFAT
jgi:chemotaxis protein CheD